MEIRHENNCRYLNRNYIIDVLDTSENLEEAKMHVLGTWGAKVIETNWIIEAIERSKVEIERAIGDSNAEVVIEIVRRNIGLE